MAQFVGRERELHVLSDQLNELRSESAGRFVWVLGRRRVGKSRLLEEFLARAGIPHVFYRAPRHRPAQALERFRQALLASNVPAAELIRAGTSFDSWPAALRIAATGASARAPVAIVLDELPYLVEHDPGVPGDIQEAWDRHLEDTPALLVAIGSDVRMMRLLTDYPSELHDRPTRELHVTPFSPLEVAQLTGTEGAHALDRYLVVGGYPALALAWRASASRREFLERALEDAATPLVVNALRIMDAEFASELQARQVIEAIGSGEASFQRIRSRSGIQNEKSLSKALDLLVTKKQLVSAELPYAAPPGRKNKRYTVIDPYLRFWLRFVGPSLDEIDRGRSDLAIERIERDWSSYRGKAIEPVVRSSVERMLADPAIRKRLNGARYVGSFWTRTNDIEVDLVGGGDPVPGEIAFVGSIKWRDRASFTARDTHALVERRTRVPGAERARLVGVSRSGFEPETGLDVRLEPDDILAAWRRRSA